MSDELVDIDLSDYNLLWFPASSLGVPLVADATVMKLIERGLLRFAPGFASTEPPGTFVSTVRICADPSLLENR